jgi:hypothetical protein
MPSDGDLYSEANIVDNQVTEDACVDYWLLPDEQLGAVKLDFVGREAVRRVLIMNTSNGFKLDRMTRRIRLELLDGGKTAYSTELDLRPHPEWTEVVLDRPASADALRIDILSYVGAGAGLNEVKVIRASPNSAEPTVTGVALLQ